MSLLLVDIGNSRIKWSLKGDGRTLAHGAHLLVESDAFAAALRNLGQPARVIACNVAGSWARQRFTPQSSIGSLCRNGSRPASGRMG